MKKFFILALFVLGMCNAPVFGMEQKNAEIIVQDGGSLIIRNNGLIQQGEDDKVNIQLGGTLQIISGEIRISE